MTGRIVIDDIRPSTPHVGYPAKAVVGEAVTVRAVVFKDGHDELAAEAQLFVAGAEQPLQRVSLLAVGNDDWEAAIVPERLGRHYLVVQAWTDQWATWSHKVRVKLAAGQEISLELAEGVELLDAAAARSGDYYSPVLGWARAALRDASLPPEHRVGPALAPEVAVAMTGPRMATDLTSGVAQPLWVDRERALVGAWYELFPRSYGGLAGVRDRLPSIEAMGFDVLYLPPVHPIGTTYRKGRNNTLGVSGHEPGSPWAIGSPDGGHTAIHPELGTLQDFDELVQAAQEHHLEVALDYALQCSPDHPWVHEHPEWFHHRPDGSIAYAENPPKKYQDIYPINFWPALEEDRVALWLACQEILEFWIGRGVRIFRVDNPHTKPIALWEWLLPTIQLAYPDVIFLAEAFTRPKVMAKLAEVGFSQSYTYFTWRTEQHGEEGIWAYVEELAHGPLADFMRPNFWPNTPDILSGPLRGGPPAAFALRAVLAATLSPSYGVYSGYELYENQPASTSTEEYLNSEKYEVPVRDFDRAGTLAPLLTSLNRVRREHPALQRLRSIQFHQSDNPSIIAYSKRSDDGADVLLMVVTLDPLAAQESVIHLDREAIGLPLGRPYPAHDLLSGQTFVWNGPTAFVRLEPWRQVAHVLDLRPAAR